MSSRELIVLGTASQVPTRHRNHNGYYLRWDGIGTLFDPGEGTQRQMIRAGLATSQVHRICVSHFHGDHCLGLSGIIQRISLDRVAHEVPIHYPASGEVYFQRLRHASIFQDEAKIVPRPLREHGQVAAGPGPTVDARRLEHTVESWGYRIAEPDGVRMIPEALAARGVHGPAVGRLLREGEVLVGADRVRLDEVSEARRGQVFAFVMDTRLCDAAVDLARGADLLLAESTYLASEQSEARERGHMTATDAAKLAVASGARRLVLAHFSQRHPRVEDYEEEARQTFADVVAVRDGDVIALPTR
jgi:ribonuclease Z